MFASYPFATTPFAGTGQKGPVYVSGSVDFIGFGNVDTKAGWIHSTTTKANGVGLMDPKIQRIVEFGLIEEGIGTFNIKSMWNLTSTIESKGYASIQINTEYIAQGVLTATGVGTADMHPGYKMFTKVDFLGKAMMLGAGSGTFQSRMSALGKGAMFGYTAYKHATQMTARGYGYAVFGGGRIIHTVWKPNGKALVNWIAVAPGDDEGEMYARGLSTFLPSIGFYAAFKFEAQGSSDTNWIMNALYQGVGYFEGESTFTVDTATKYTSVFRANAYGYAAFAAFLARKTDSSINAVGKAIFTTKSMWLFNSMMNATGKGYATVNTQYAQRIYSKSNMNGIAYMRGYFSADAKSTVTMLGVGQFQLRTTRILNSRFRAQGNGYTNFLPGNPLHNFLPEANDTVDMVLDDQFTFEWADDMLLMKIDKQPADRKDYDINFKKWLFQRDPEDSLDSVDYNIIRISGKHADNNPLQVELIQLTTTTAKVWISQGTDCSVYKVELTVNTVRGRKIQSEILVKVLDV